MVRAACKIGGLVAVLLTITSVVAHAQQPRRVLILHSFGRDFAPFTIVASAFKTELAGQSPEPIEFHEASLETARFSAAEAEVVDSASGERLAAAVDSQSGGRLGIVAGLQTYGHARQVMDGWAERFVKRLDTIHGSTK